MLLLLGRGCESADRHRGTVVLLLLRAKEKEKAKAGRLTLGELEVELLQLLAHVLGQLGQVEHPDLRHAGYSAAGRLQLSISPLSRRPGPGLWHPAVHVSCCSPLLRLLRRATQCAQPLLLLPRRRRLVDVHQLRRQALRFRATFLFSVFIFSHGAFSLAIHERRFIYIITDMQLRHCHGSTDVADEHNT